MPKKSARIVNRATEKPAKRSSLWLGCSEEMASSGQATYLCGEETPSSSIPCAPPPSPVAGGRRTFTVLSSSPELDDPQNCMEVSDHLLVALSRMSVEQSTLKRKKHSEHELPAPFELAEISGRERSHHDQKRVKCPCHKKRAINSALNSTKLLHDLVPGGSVKKSIAVPST